MNIHKWMASGLTAFAALTGVLLCSATQANASFSNFSLSSSFGAFSDPESIAVDESTGDVYVYNFEAGEKAVIEKFDAAGDPVDFSALATNTIALGEARGQNEAQVAVDNSSGPAKGDIYVADGSFGNTTVLIYGSDGKALGELSEAAGVPWGRPRGVTVNRAGNVYVGLYLPNGVNRYTPNANPVTNGDYAGSLTEVSTDNVGADDAGDVYGDIQFAGVTKYDASQFGADRVEGTQVAAKSSTLAVANSLSGELFVDRQGEIVQYDASGNILSTFGSDAAGIGFNAKNGKLYISNDVSKTVEIWQGAVALPTLETDRATHLDTTGSATLNGAVEPEGSPIGTCVFQYGASVAYGSVASCEQETPLTGGGTVAVSADLPDVLLNNLYHYRLTAENENGIADGADETFIILVPPTVDDRAPTASSITRASAKLTGTIDPEQGDTRYHFEVGVTESYGQSTPVTHIGSGISGDTTVVQQVSELLPGTTYHYRLVADNVAGRVVGADHTFTTGAAVLPVVRTGGSSGVAPNSATITGLLGTNGLPTTYGFELGTSTDYGPATGLGSVGAGLSEAPVSLALTGLLPGTTYHYRLTATNLDGTSYGADETFTTGTFTNTFAVPPAPLPFVAVPAVAFPQEALGSSTTTPKALTRAQKLAAALKACHKKAKAKRAGCEKQARKKYGTAKQKRRKK